MLEVGDQFGLYSNAIRESIQWVTVRVDDCGSPSGLVIANDDPSFAHMTFAIRSTQGNGELSQESNSDPLFGQCVQQNSVAFLQSTMQDGLWLGMTARNDAQIGNVGSTLISILTDPITYPQWIISTTLSDGSNSHVLACQAIPKATKGSWVAINGMNNGNQQKVSFMVGTTKANSQEVTTTDAWKKSITDTVSGGFQFLGASNSVEVPVTGVFSESQQSSINEALMQCWSQTIEADFNQGQVWQFVLNTADVCDVTGFSITVEELVLTKGKNDYPCCLPGYFVDDNNPHGPCVSVNGINSPCACSDDICKGTPPSRGLRGSMN
jgi:CEL-III C-terminal